MSKKNKGGANLGRTLIKDRFGRSNRKKVDNDSMLHTTEVQDGYDWGRLNLASVTEESSFQEFLRTAELAGTEFQAEKLNIKFVNHKVGAGLLTKTEQERMLEKHKVNRDMLKIPRRPKWTGQTTAQELQDAENEIFVIWRRQLALLQENEAVLLTPYEKNPDFWRQLWRVVERSDVVVQIVDARNPLLFRNEDLERYVHEVDPRKMNMILVNKSDLLTEQQRKHWAQYFDEKLIRTAFFSAILVDEELKKKQNSDDNNIEPEQQKSVEELKHEAQVINASLDKLETQLSEIEHKIANAVIAPTPNVAEPVKNSWQLLSRLQLIELFRSIYSGPTYTANVTTIGLVGYPNVGKSSTINALFTQKKVSVSATPGKTKHFQTLYLDNDLMLCDCPGLVMPSFVLTKADMILNGILPIDQMRDHVPPVNLLCTRIPRHVLEDKYGIMIAKPIEGEDANRSPHAEELLLAYGYNRGFMTANGQPDQARSARYVLKDFVNGKLLYCVAPPNVPQEAYHSFPARSRRQQPEQTLPIQQQRAMRINNNTSSQELDNKFFQSNNNQAYVQGRSNFPHVRVMTEGTSVANTPMEKPWRMTKKNHREKLRKKFAHLDQH